MIRNPRKFIKQTTYFQASASATQTTTTIDLLGWRTARITQLVQVLADTASLAVTLTDSADDSSYAAVSGGPSIAVAGTDDNTVKDPVDLNLGKLRRYLRIVQTYAGSGAFIAPIVVQLFDPINSAQASDSATEFGFG